VVEADTSEYPITERSDHDASADSSITLPRGHGDLSLPTAAGDLRTTFDLPLLGEAGPTPARGAKAADVLALFEEKKSAPKRPTGAEARAKARRCPTCGGVVPAGMSICGTCGLDLESGTRVQLDDDLLPEARPRVAAAPLPVTVIAFVSLLGSVLLAGYSLIQWLNAVPGWMYFVPICLFGVYSAVRMLQGRTAKLLIVALTLGAVVDVVALIAMPIFKANEDAKVVPNTQSAEDPEAAAVVIEPITERLDTQTLSVGIAILLLYAAVSAYLASPAVRRHFAAKL